MKYIMSFNNYYGVYKPVQSSQRNPVHGTTMDRYDVRHPITRLFGPSSAICIL